MPPHPYFDLELLDDNTLNHYLPAPIIARRTIHEWPLSCVQQITCQDATQHIYKSQAHPSVESAIYRSITAAHLLAATVINEHHLILPYVAQTALTRDPAAEAQHILMHIAAMPRHTPVYQTLNTFDAWLARMHATVSSLQELVHATTFQRLTHRDIARINEFAHHPEMQALWQGVVGVVHGDLTPENMIHTATCTYIIDWQRPLYAPIVIDRWMLEQTLQLPSTTPTMTQALCVILEIAWLTDAATRWFPAGIPHYDGHIHALVQRL